MGLIGRKNKDGEWHLHEPKTRTSVCGTKKTLTQEKKVEIDEIKEDLCISCIEYLNGFFHQENKSTDNVSESKKYATKNSLIDEYREKEERSRGLEPK